MMSYENIFRVIYIAIALQKGEEQAQQMRLWTNEKLHLDTIDYLCEYEGRYTFIPNEALRYRGIDTFLPYVHEILG